MHVTVALQITKYSLINNSCMLVQSETQLRSGDGTVYYQLQEYSMEDISCMQKEFIPWRLRNYFWVWWLCDEANSHRWQNWTPREIAQGNRRLGGLEEAYVETIQSMSYIVRLYWELDGMWAEALCNLNIFPLLWYYRDQGFRLRLSWKYSSVFMCDCFLILSYMCSIWSFSYSIKIPQVCCRSRTCIFL